MRPLTDAALLARDCGLDGDQKPITAATIAARTTHCGPAVDRLRPRRRRRRSPSTIATTRRPPSPSLAGAAAEELLTAPLPGRSRRVRPNRAAPSLGSVADPCGRATRSRLPRRRILRLGSATRRAHRAGRAGGRARAGPRRSDAADRRGRTDAGVHAWGQVASFAAERAAGGARPGAQFAHRPRTWSSGQPLPAGDFDARRDALSRTYCYRVLAERSSNPFEGGISLYLAAPGRPRRARRLRRRAPRHPRLHSVHPHADGARPLRARHPAGGVAREAAARDGSLELWIEADAFMRNMVRVLVGTMLEVAGGTIAGSRTSGRCSRALRGSGRGRPPGPTASTSPRCATEVGTGWPASAHS